MINDEKPTSYGPISSSKETLFWSKVIKPDSESCWYWRTRSNNPSFNVNGVTASCARLSYELTYGVMPQEFDCVKKCLNKTCVNPSHLAPGTRGSVKSGSLVSQMSDIHISSDLVVSGKDQMRFWKYVDKTDPSTCWKWKGPKDKDGYGRTYVAGRNFRAHRISYEMSKGLLPEGLMVCHSCDNPPCVNPTHLFPGTGTDNIEDMLNKGRQLSGSKSHLSTITETVALSIKEELAKGIKTHERLAEQFGCSVSIVDKIACGAAWTHVGKDIDMCNRRIKGNYKLTLEDVVKIKTELLGNVSRSEIASMYNVSKSAIDQIAAGKNWSHV